MKWWDQMPWSFSECWVLSQHFQSSLSPSSRSFSVPLHFLPLQWYHLNIWGCWYFSQQSWFQLVNHTAWHITRCTLHLLISWINRWQHIALTYFINFEPVSCFMPSFNCCFLTCIQVSQEAGRVVWDSNLSKSVSEFVVIHTGKGFSVVNEPEVDVFLEFPWFF